MYRQHKIIWLVLICLFTSAHARVFEFENRTKASVKMNQASLVALLVYEADCCKRKDPGLRSIKDSFRAVSENSRYKYANMTFIALNSNADATLMHDLGLRSIPAVVLLQAGSPVRNNAGAVAQLAIAYDGNEFAINDFIDDYLGGTVDEVARQKNERERELEQASLAAWSVGWNPCYCGGYYGGCSFGCGFGWGGTSWCW